MYDTYSGKASAPRSRRIASPDTATRESHQPRRTKPHQDEHARSARTRLPPIPDSSSSVSSTTSAISELSSPFCFWLRGRHIRRRRYRAVLAAQWRTIDRGGHSIYEEIKSSRPYCLALPCRGGLGCMTYAHSVSSDPSQPMTPARHAAHDPQVHRHRALRMRRVCRRRRVPLLLELAAHALQ
jgi:hypothetical protein